MRQQLQFPWYSPTPTLVSRRIRRPRRRSATSFKHRWPPRKGEILYFETDSGIQAGVFREVRQGLVWVDYLLEDGRIIAEHRLVMCPTPTPWRDPGTVTEEERKRSVECVRTRVEAGVDPRRDPDLWADLLQYGMYVLLQLERQGEVEPLENGPALQRVN